MLFKKNTSTASVLQLGIFDIPKIESEFECEIVNRLYRYYDVPRRLHYVITHLETDIREIRKTKTIKMEFSQLILCLSINIYFDYAE